MKVKHTLQPHSNTESIEANDAVGAVHAVLPLAEQPSQQRAFRFNEATFQKMKAFVEALVAEDKRITAAS